jgi:hypothetical protein
MTPNIQAEQSADPDTKKLKRPVRVSEGDFRTETTAMRRPVPKAI